ncbi:uncharacterized protein LOC118645371 [Monomorium pharaonis]|uniref:uncharacterized protein LOC118645371 n=1 Tax=Monomorium pharaonis TaxID=307658 RepID=UPI001746A1F4|nr:uncharacterized protein LOC118645371 [Monomorium pharaonis]
MAEKTVLPTVPLLTGDNYFNWRMKMESVLQLRRLTRVLSSDRPSGDDKKKEKEDWDEKNADAVACIRLSLSDNQILQFANETNAKRLWKAIHDTYAGPAEDRAIDTGEELKNIKMTDSKTITDYVSRARGLAMKCASSGLNTTERQVVYSVVRGLHNKFAQIREILKTQREKRLDENLEILKEKERELLKKNNGDKDNRESAYAAKNFRKKDNKKKCFVCGKIGHMAKHCFYRKDKFEQGENSVTKLMERGLKANFTDNKVKICNEKEVIATGRRFGNHFAIQMIPITRDTRYDYNNTYSVNEDNNVTNTGINNEIKNVNCEPCKMCKLPRKPHKNIIYDQSEKSLDLVHLDTFKEKCKNILGRKIKRIRTDNGRAFDNKQFDELTCREEIEHQKTVPYNPESNGKVERGNRPSGKKGIMLEYSRERIAYRIFDIENKIVIEERNVVFDENQKGSNYLKNATDDKFENLKLKEYMSIVDDRDISINNDENVNIDRNDQDRIEDDNINEDDQDRIDDNRNDQDRIEDLDDRNVNEYRTQDRENRKVDRPKTYFSRKSYLHGTLKETVYLEPPPGFENRFGKGKACKLKKALYGLPQSGRNWYCRLKEELLNNDLRPLASENCIFTNNNETCFFAFASYVNDFTILDDDRIRITSDYTGIYLDQIEYIEKLLDKHSIVACRVSPDTSLKRQSADGPIDIFDRPVAGKNLLLK